MAPYHISNSDLDIEPLAQCQIVTEPYVSSAGKSVGCIITHPWQSLTLSLSDSFQNIKLVVGEQDQMYRCVTDLINNLDNGCGIQGLKKLISEMDNCGVCVHKACDHQDTAVAAKL